MTYLKLKKQITVFTLAVTSLTACKKNDVIPPDAIVETVDSTTLSARRIRLGGGGTGAVNTYYISTSGNDATGTGAIGSPWKTLSKATATVSISGAVIHVNAGTYTETQQSILKPGVSIEGEGVTSVIKSSFSHRYEGIIHGVSPAGTNGNQHISNLKFDGQSLANANCIEIQGRSNVSLHDITLQDFMYSGIILNGEDHYISAAPSVFATGNSIYNCTINNCAGYIAGTLEGCIQIGGQSGFLIYNNVITQNQRTSGNNGEPIKYYSDGYLKNGKIYGNTFTRSLSTGTDWDFNIEFFNESGLEFYNNTFVNGSIDLNKNTKGIYAYSAYIHDNVFLCTSKNSATQTGVQLEFNTEFVNIEKNHFTNYSHIVNFTPRTADIVSNITIRNNLAESLTTTAAQNGSFIGGFSNGSGTFYIDAMYVYNNTVSGAASGVQNFWAIDLGNALAGYSVKNVFIKNNIISGFALGVRNQSQSRFYNSEIAYNDFYGNGDNTALPAWPSSTILDGSTTMSNNISANPLFIGNGNYTLQSGSTCINTGVNVGLPYNGSAPDKGYAEF